MVRSLTHDNVEEGILNVEGEDITNIIEDVDAQINSMTSEFGADKLDAEFSIKVYRVIEGKGELAWLFACVPSELPIMQKLQDDYEGGRFEVRIYKNKKIYRRIPVVVAPPVKKKDVEKIVPQNDLTALVNAISQQQERQFNQLKETLLQIAGKNTSPAPDPMAMMGSMMAALVQMKNFITPAAQPTNSLPPEKMVDLIIKGMELGKDSGGGSETNMLDVLKEAFKSPLLLAAANSLQQPVINHNPMVNRAPAKVAVNPANPANPNKLQQRPTIVPKPKQENLNMNNILVHNLNMLVEKAENDSDPILYAEFILDNVPEETIKEYILKDDLIEEMQKINPKVLEYKNWFIEMRDHIKMVLTEEGAGGDITDNEPSPAIESPNDPIGVGGDATNT